MSLSLLLPLWVALRLCIVCSAKSPVLCTNRKTFEKVFRLFYALLRQCCLVCTPSKVSSIDSFWYRLGWVFESCYCLKSAENKRNEKCCCAAISADGIYY